MSAVKKINEIIQAAIDLKITITIADHESEIYKCWADRVLLARMLAERGNLDGCEKMRAEANRYAV